MGLIYIFGCVHGLRAVKLALKSLNSLSQKLQHTCNLTLRGNSNLTLSADKTSSFTVAPKAYITDTTGVSQLSAEAIYSASPKTFSKYELSTSKCVKLMPRFKNTRIPL